MGSDLIDRYTAIKEENTREERRVTPLRTKERSVTYRGSEEIPQKVIEKLEATELKNDNDTETSLRYNFTQMFSGNKSFFSIIVLFLDTLLVGIYFTIVGYTFAWFLNSFTIHKLKLKKEDGSYDPEYSKPKVFAILILECLSVVFAIYIAIQLVLRLPFLVKKAPLFHRDYRIYSGGIILIYTLMSLQGRMQEKARYVFDKKRSSEDENVTQLIDCAKEVDGTAPSWINFRDCIDNIN